MLGKSGLRAEGIDIDVVPCRFCCYRWCSWWFFPPFLPPPAKTAIHVEDR